MNSGLTELDWQGRVQRGALGFGAELMLTDAVNSTSAGSPYHQEIVKPEQPERR